MISTAFLAVAFVAARLSFAAPLGSREGTEDVMPCGLLCRARQVATASITSAGAIGTDVPVSVVPTLDISTFTVATIDDPTPTADGTNVVEARSPQIVTGLPTTVAQVTSVAPVSTISVGPTLVTPTSTKGIISFPTSSAVIINDPTSAVVIIDDPTSAAVIIDDPTPTVGLVQVRSPQGVVVPPPPPVCHATNVTGKVPDVTAPQILATQVAVRQVAPTGAAQQAATESAPTGAAQVASAESAPTGAAQVATAPTGAAQVATEGSSAVFKNKL